MLGEIALGSVSLAIGTEGPATLLARFGRSTVQKNVASETERYSLLLGTLDQWCVLLDHDLAGSDAPLRHVVAAQLLVFDQLMVVTKNPPNLIMYYNRIVYNIKYNIHVTILKSVFNLSKTGVYTSSRNIFGIINASRFILVHIFNDCIR